MKHRLVSSRHNLLLCSVLLLSPLLNSNVCGSDLPTTPRLHSPYRLQLRLLTPPSTQGQLQAQKWSAVFQRLGHSVTIASDDGRTPLKIQTDRSTVRAVGLIDRRTQKLKLGTRSFARHDDQQLSEFLKQLQEHGPDGPIRERPTWGLSNDQYQAVVALLRTTTVDSVPNTTVAAAVQSLAVPTEFRITWTAAAQKTALNPGVRIPELNLQGLSTGSGLAIVLAQAGLGFRVLPAPRSEQNYLLEIDRGSETDNLWPIGWKHTHSLVQIVPALYQDLDVDLPEADVEPLIQLIADRVKLPWFQARQPILDRGIQLEQLTYSRRPGQASPDDLLRSISRKHRLGIAPRTDEAGTVFLWVTTAEDHKAWDRRLRAKSGPKLSRPKSAN